jgi:2,4-dienoyl-CoA reductase-like NADH-dependent reductase (Old Yellow Enzyme family)
VGLITTAEQAEGILQDGDADVIFMAREFLRNPAVVTHFAYDLGAKIQTPHEYERGHTRMYAKH